MERVADWFRDPGDLDHRTHQGIRRDAPTNEIHKEDLTAGLECVTSDT